GLRTPKTSATTYALSARRTQPLSGPWYAPIVNHLGVTGTYIALGNRSEFQDGSRRRFNLSGDYFVTLPVAGSGPGGGAERGLAAWMPPWLSASGQAPGRFNLRPTSFRVTSGLARDNERRESFLKPASAEDDSGRVARGESSLWRNASSLELQPLRHLTARADAVVLRDLRDYATATPNGAAANDERGSFLGLDAGFERERQLASSMTYAPEVADWVRPRLDLATSFSLLRDPNAPLIARGARPTVPTPGAQGSRIPLRLGNTRTITAGAGIDLSKAATRFGGPASLSARVAHYLQPVDVSITRGTLSSFDASSGSPGLGYQLGIGSLAGFRSLGGGLANSAGASSQVALSSGLNLPLAVALTNRLQRTTTRNWARRLETDQTTIDGDQVVFPDLNVRWAPAGPLFGGLVKSAGVNGRLLHTRQSLLVPAVLLGAAPEERATRVKTYPLNASLTFGPGEVTTTAGYSYRTQVDSLPGSVTNGSSRETSAEVGRTFRVPSDWSLKSGIRARLGYQQAQTQSYVQNLFAASRRSRLTDNGRQAFTLNADTDVADNATFSIQGSRIVNFDRNLNRRLTQTVITAVLQMQFFAGDLR
ncbi:MAG TPA: hypothetical protein VM076_16410, partial [Gemmatimonadaceae bacterium]|nr:hypothetical protein [Gemmatimonadaceae bacterium]